MVFMSINDLKSEVIKRETPKHVEQSKRYEEALLMNKKLIDSGLIQPKGNNLAPIEDRYRIEYMR